MVSIFEDYGIFEKNPRRVPVTIPQMPPTRRGVDASAIPTPTRTAPTMKRIDEIA
jgi:hypothetical protein